jgi:hypothetical protein
MSGCIHAGLGVLLGLYCMSVAFHVGRDKMMEGVNTKFTTTITSPLIGRPIDFVSCNTDKLAARVGSLGEGAEEEEEENETQPPNLAWLRGYSL